MSIFIMKSVKMKMAPQKQDNPLVNTSAMAQFVEKSSVNNKTKTVNDAVSNSPINEYHKSITFVD